MYKCRLQNLFLSNVSKKYHCVGGLTLFFFSKVSILGNVCKGKRPRCWRLPAERRAGSAARSPAARRPDRGSSRPCRRVRREAVDRRRHLADVAGIPYYVSLCGFVPGGDHPGGRHGAGMRLGAAWYVVDAAALRRFTLVSHSLHAMVAACFAADDSSLGASSDSSRGASNPSPWPCSPADWD